MGLNTIDCKFVFYLFVVVSIIGMGLKGSDINHKYINKTKTYAHFKQCNYARAYKNKKKINATDC
jgi:hypothetical protein